MSQTMPPSIGQLLQRIRDLEDCLTECKPFVSAFAANTETMQWRDARAVANRINHLLNTPITKQTNEP